MTNRTILALAALATLSLSSFAATTDASAGWGRPGGGKPSYGGGRPTGSHGHYPRPHYSHWPRPHHQHTSGSYRPYPHHHHVHRHWYPSWNVARPYYRPSYGSAPLPSYGSALPAYNPAPCYSCEAPAPVRQIEPCNCEAPAPKPVYIPVPVRVEVPVPVRVEVRVPVKVPVYIPVKTPECDCEEAAPSTTRYVPRPQPSHIEAAPQTEECECEETQYQTQSPQPAPRPWPRQYDQASVQTEIQK